MFASFVLGVYTKTLLIPSIAVVNLEQVLAQSPKLSNIQQNKEKKLNELLLWIDKINLELEAEKDKAKRDKLAEQYKEITHEKEMVIKQEYNSRLKEVDAEITVLIDKVAKQNGCNAVFSNISMVSGGKDITDEVLKLLK